MPWRWIAVQAARSRMSCGGAADGAGEGGGVDGGELEAGGGAGVQRGDVGVDHRVGEAAGAGDDGDAAVAQAVELGQAAGLEARGDDDGVAAGLHQVGERLVVADDGADAAGELGGERAEGASRGRLAGAEDGEAVAGADDVLGGDPGEEVDALLPGQAADEDEERASRRCGGRSGRRARRGSAARPWSLRAE